MSNYFQRFIVYSFVALLTACICGSADSVSAQTQLCCDPQIKSIENSSDGYRLRDDRCEGLYREKVATTSLHVASLISFAENVDLSAGKKLLIGWNSPTDGTVYLHAEIMRHETNYRMDTRRPALSGPYAWPTDLLAQNRVKQNELGVIARMTSLILGENRDLYVPVTLTQRSRPVGSTTLKLTLIPGAELSRVNVTLAPLLKDKIGKPILKDKRLNGNLYPAERPFDIELNTPGSAGIYFLQVGAILRAGGSVSINVWFYNPS